MSNEQEKEILYQQISSLEAAVADLNFECQKLEILNNNLELQLKEANQELSSNIMLLQQAHDENDRLTKELERAKEHALRLGNIDSILLTAHDYAKSILNATKLGSAPDSDKIEDAIYVNQINDLLEKMTEELNKASDKIKE